MGIKTFYNWLRMAAISLLLTIGLLRTADAQNYNTYKSLPKSKGKHTITGRYREENGKFILSDIHFEGGISMTQTPSKSCSRFWTMGEKTNGSRNPNSSRNSRAAQASAP